MKKSDFYFVSVLSFSIGLIMGILSMGILNNCKEHLVEYKITSLEDFSFRKIDPRLHREAIFLIDQLKDEKTISDTSKNIEVYQLGRTDHNNENMTLYKVGFAISSQDDKLYLIKWD